MRIMDDRHFYSILAVRRDIIDIIELYNTLERNLDFKNTNEVYISTVKSILEMRGIKIISDPDFFDDNVMEIPGEAKGIIIKKELGGKFNQIRIIENPYNLSENLKNSYVIKTRVRNEQKYDIKLYRALCNNQWCRKGIFSSYSWRTAGEIVSELKNKEHGRIDHLDYYCLGGEGIVDPEIEKDFNFIGWSLKNDS
jgi:hypothetical protein